MSFRSILLLISLSVIAFCFSLYFQRGQSNQSINMDEYTNLTYNEERSHSLKEFNEKIIPLQLDQIIGRIYDKNKFAGEKTRVMEIGAGNGRVIMELKKQFPEVEFYGINKEKTHTFYRRESFIATALKFEIMTKDELEQSELPYLVFQDLDFGRRIPYAENKFDLIFSQNTIRHIKYKFELFSEIMRVLKPSGISIHTDLPAINIYDKGLVLEFKDALALIRKMTEINIKTLENPRTLYFTKKKTNVLFPLLPHHALPANLENISQELKRPEMGYNIKYD